MVKPFPPITGQRGAEERNPAIQCFGLRLFADQTVSELLLELLLVAVSEKRVDRKKLGAGSLLPDLGLLRSWPAGTGLEYAPQARLNLKLFAFLGASRLETRHHAHRDHYRKLISVCSDGRHLALSGGADKMEVLRTLENLFLGFQGVGGKRTWCAASFLPIARELIGGESIWQETKAARANVCDWEASLPFFSHSQQIFLARGGELLYLQLCNALRQEPVSVRSWFSEAGIGFSSRESDPEELHPALARGLSTVLDACPETVGKLATFLDTGVDAETAQHTDFKPNTNEPRFTSCGWCPEESWREGLLFGVELLRLCEAVVDPIERLELLEIACAMQLLRSLCAQSARYTTRASDSEAGAGPLAYVWAISDPAGRHTAVKQISRRNVNAVQRMIHDAIRHPSIRDGFTELSDNEVGKIYKEADSRYGHKLFLTVAKRIGLVVPKRGAGARFVLNEKLLRYLVLATIRPGERVTFDSFKRLVFAHYGLAVDDETIGQSCLWSGTPRLTTLGGDADAWLTKMLDASGMLIRLSDSCSLVTNPFDGGERLA